MREAALALLLAILGAEPPSDDEAARKAVATYLSLLREDVLLDGEVVSGRPEVVAVVDLGECAIPFLIDSLRQRGAHERLPLIDAALLAILSRQPLDRIVPLGSKHRGIRPGDQERLGWLRWAEEGCPSHLTVPGVAVPTAAYGWCLRPPEGWPYDDREPTSGVVRNQLMKLLTFIDPKAGPAIPPWDSINTLRKGADPGSRRGALLLLDRWGGVNGLADLVADVGRPADAVLLERALVRFPAHEIAIRAAMTKLATRDPTVARRLLTGTTRTARAAGLLALLRRRVLTDDEAMSALDAAGFHVRREAMAEMARTPTAWAHVLLARLDDCCFDASEALRKALRAGAIEPGAAAAGIQRHHASIHAFVRIRASAAMLGVSNSMGRRWLLEELTLQRSRIPPPEDPVLLGRIEGLLGLGAGGGSRAPVNLAPVVLPSESFEIQVVRIPFLFRRTYEVLVLWKGAGKFSRQAAYRWTWAALGGGASRGGSSRAAGGGEAHSFAAGEAAFRTTFEYASGQTADPGGGQLEVQLILPDGRPAVLRGKVPKPEPAVHSDLMLMRLGLRSRRTAIRRIHQRLFTWQHHGGLHVVSSRTSEKQRKEVLLLLLEALEAHDARTTRVRFAGLVEPPPSVWRETGGPGQTDPEAFDLLDSVRALSAEIEPEHLDRLLRLRDGRTIRSFGRWAPTSVMDRALAMREPLGVRNAAVLSTCGRSWQYEATEELKSRIGIWLRSSDHLTLQAGLVAAIGSGLMPRPEPFDAALARAISSRDPETQRTGLRVATVLRRPIETDLGELYLTAKDEGVRDAALRALLVSRSRPEPGILVRIVREALDSWADHPHRGRIMALARRDLERLGVDNLVSAWRKTRDVEWMDILVEKGHDFGSPVLDRIVSTPVFAQEIGGIPRGLVRSEIDRLTARTPETAVDLYCRRLEEGLRLGDTAASAVACVALTFERDDRSRRLLMEARNSEVGALRDLAVTVLGYRERSERK